MERATQKLEQRPAEVTTSDARGLSVRRTTRPDRVAMVPPVLPPEAPPASPGLTAPRTGPGSFGSPSGLGSRPFGG